MLIFCLLLLIFSQHMGAEAVYCMKELPCNITKCFKIRDSENAVLLVCSSIQQTEHCSISGTHIKLKCDVQLHCFCNKEGPFELDVSRATPEICKKQLPCSAPECFDIMGSPEPACTSTSHTDLCRFNGSCIEYKCDAALTCKCKGSPVKLADLGTECPGKHVESFSGTLWKTAVAVAVAVAVAILIIWHIRKNRGSLCSGCRRKDTERQGDPELGETGPQTPPLAEGQMEVELDDMNDASIKHSPRPVEAQGQDASDGAAGRGAGVVHSQVAPKNKTKKGKGEDGEGHGEGPPRVPRPEEEPLVTGEMEGNPE